MAKKAAKKGGKKPAAKKAMAKKPAKKAAAKAAKKPARKAAAKKPAKKAAKAGGSKRRGGGAAFMAPVTPDAVLAPVVGDQPRPRTEIVSRLWAYIRNRGLQDKVNRRMINADENLARVFGGRSQVSMFEMTKLVNEHLQA